jgi:hypothetical protein
MAGTKTFSSDNVIMAYLGQELQSGLADGTFVTVERNEDTYSLTVGADGEATRSRSNNRSAKITFTVIASSRANDILSSAMQADEVKGVGIGPFFLKELNGSTIVVAPETWVVKPPTLEFGKEVSNREWTLETSYSEIFVGGID